MLPERLSKATRLFARLPGVGEKTAQRFVLHLALATPELARELGQAIRELHDVVRPCSRCGHLAELTEPDAPPVCAICQDSRRNAQLLCVVFRVSDLLAIERAGVMRGRYFVLGKLLSPLEGIGPSDLPLGALLRRIEEDAVTEVILATPPSVDGEATALWLARELAPKNLRISRIASGVPHGGDLELTDMVTLGRAIEGRKLLG